MRTPLTTLRGNLGRLRRHPPSPPEEQADILADMVNVSDRLIGLVNDLLLLARAPAGRNLAAEPLEIQPLVEKSHAADTHNRSTAKDYPEWAGWTVYPWRRDAFKQVMFILLDNALKQLDGPVEIPAEAQKDQVLIRVRDHGEGMHAETLAHIFDRFYRAGEHVNSPGLGLGLPMARALVERQGGTISIECQSGRGWEVLVIFQLSQGSL